MKRASRRGCAQHPVHAHAARDHVGEHRAPVAVQRVRQTGTQRRAGEGEQPIGRRHHAQVRLGRHAVRDRDGAGRQPDRHRDVRVGRLEHDDRRSQVAPRARARAPGAARADRPAARASPLGSGPSSVDRQATLTARSAPSSPRRRSNTLVADRRIVERQAIADERQGVERSAPRPGASTSRHHGGPGRRP